MDLKILCVDDDENILSAYQRHLRKQFQIDTAASGAAALEAIASRGPYAIVVSDMRMPGMDGIQLLSIVKGKAPDTIRMMLTGNHDVQTAIQAVNEGSIFRFLTKPCSPECLSQALLEGLKQYRLVMAEHELLEKTLTGSVRVLTEMLSLIDAQSFGRTETLKEYAGILARWLGIEVPWEIEVAALLSQLGMVTVPAAVASKLRNGLPLAAREQQMVANAPEIARNLLSNIPRLEPVSRIIYFQNKHYDGTGFPEDAEAGEQIPIGARILKVVSDLLQIEARDIPRAKALHLMRQRQGWYDLKTLDAAAACLAPLAETETGEAPAPRRCSLNDLHPGQVLAAPLEAADGRLLLSAGTRITGAALIRIRNMAEYNMIREPVMIRIGSSREGAASR